jgi:Fe-S-cluster containining protein
MIPRMCGRVALTAFHLVGRSIFALGKTILADPALYDCQTCGACCVQFGLEDGNTYVYLDQEESRRMWSLGLPVIRQAMGCCFLGAAPHEGAGGRPACAAFVGHLGGPCGCLVYKDRPSVCREFEVGGPLCEEARRQAGLPI